METMSPQQGTMGQNRSDSLTGENKALPDNKKVPVTLLCGTFFGADGVFCFFIVDTVCLRTEMFGALINQYISVISIIKLVYPI